MMRQCDACSAEYLAKRRSSRFCSGRCRKKAHGGAATLAGHAKVLELAPDEPSALLLAITSELAAAGRLNSSLGRQAILLAGRIGAPADTGSSVAAVSKELRAVMAKALDDAEAGVDPLDELRARRDRKRAAGR
jgi:hypothetical protein